MTPATANGGPGLHRIGDVARLTGLTVPAVRYYSDAGLVPPAARTPTGYRLYDQVALARLELIQTLRALGVDLATIGQVLAGRQTLAELAGAQASALEAQIRMLKLRQAVLRYVAAHGADPRTTAEAHRLAALSAGERRGVIADLLDEATAGLDLEPSFAASLRAATPDLPPDPTVAQVGAWVELGCLIRDPAFRSAVRCAFERHDADRASGADSGDPATWKSAEQELIRRAGDAIAAGIAPTSAEAEPVVDAMVACLAAAHRRDDGLEFRGWVAERIRIGADPRVARYAELLARITGNVAGPSPLPAAEWLLEALDASSARAARD